jgi:hypothetical protein
VASSTGSSNLPPSAKFLGLVSRAGRLSPNGATAHAAHRENELGWLAERPIAPSWKGGEPNRSGRSNRPPSAKFGEASQWPPMALVSKTSEPERALRDGSPLSPPLCTRGLGPRGLVKAMVGKGRKSDVLPSRRTHVKLDQTRERQRWIIGGFPPSVIVPIQSAPSSSAMPGKGTVLAR